MLYQTFGNQLTLCQSFKKAFQNQINSESNPVGVNQNLAGPLAIQLEKIESLPNP